jgi:hypothetical protein
MNPPTQRLRILFVGAQQAGKSTMMCGWYHLAKEVFAASPDKSFEQNADFIRSYDRYVSESVMDPNVQGVVTRALFQCQHKFRKFELELIDYSGEDILSVSSKFLHGRPGPDGQLTDFEQEFVSDLRKASWIVMVHDPTRVAEGTVEQTLDTLWLATALPSIIFGGQNGVITNLTVYLSKADTAEPATITKAQTNVRQALKPSGHGKIPIRCANAKVWEGPRKSKHLKAFEDLFTQTMLKVLNASVPPPPLPSTSKLKTWQIFLAFPVAILLGLAILAWPNKSGATANGLDLNGEIQEIKNKCDQSIDYSMAQSFLKELQHIQERVEKEGSRDRAQLIVICFSGKWHTFGSSLSDIFRC